MEFQSGDLRKPVLKRAEVSTVLGRYAISTCPFPPSVCQVGAQPALHPEPTLRTSIIKFHASPHDIILLLLLLGQLRQEHQH